MKQLAEKIGNDYRRFGEFLRVKPFTIEAIEGDKEKVVDRAYEIVKAWKYATEKPTSYVAYVTLKKAVTKLNKGIENFVYSGEWIETSELMSV